MLIRRPQDIGSFVKSTRTAKGLNQQQLADRVGVSRRWLNRLEGGVTTSQLGLVLRALNELEITLTATSDQIDMSNNQDAASQPTRIDIDDIADTGLSQAKSTHISSEKRRRK